MKEKNIYNLTRKELLEKFKTSLSGLSGEEAKTRLKEYGPNKIVKKQDWKWLKIIFSQFNDALVWILLVAAGLAYLFHELRDVSIILIIVGINATIGFFQEWKAERIMEGIRKLTTDKALVVREGKKAEVHSAKIVPGDVVALSAGDYVPSDGYLLESYDLRINSFVFTGESKPQNKRAGKLEGENLGLADRSNMVFSGETVATGEAKFLVTGTGMETELGKLARLTAEVEDDPTPMQKQMRILGRDVTILALLVGTLVIIGGQYFQMSLYQNFLFALALSVSVVPEGLPAAISVALSLGMKRLLKDNVLAKKLSAVETLGSVSIICTDKTGTITQNELTVVKVVLDDQILEVSGAGYDPQGNFYADGKKIDPQKITGLDMLFRIGTLCNNAGLIEKGGDFKVVGDPTEGALLVAGKKFDNREDFFQLGEQKINENPFSSERMRMSVIYKNKETHSFVKGSPEVLLDLCDYKLEKGRVTAFTDNDKKKKRKIYNQMSAEGLRVLAFAYRDMHGVVAKKYLDEAERKLVWVGMMAMIDPPRIGVAEAIYECKKLGIKPIMITGDYEITARAIAQKVGLIENGEPASNRGGGTYEIINGKRLDEMKDRAVFALVQKGDVIFARIAPEQKLRIATILKNNKQVIAMTGDGVNDAPALKKADIGVAMGIMGTDVSKEAADMILLDDNFASIVKGIEEGRTIFKNLRKFVHYVFTSNASELFTVVFGVILQIPLPISAVQILAIDLGTDILPSFSLSFEPKEPGAREKKRTNAQNSIINWQGFRRIMYLGIIMATGAVITFILSMLRGGWHFGEVLGSDAALYIRSTTAAYAVLSMTQMANLLQSRSEKLTPWQLGFFKNKYTIGAIVISTAMLLLFMYLPFFQHYLRMSPIGWKDWLAVVVSTGVVYLFEEARKGGNK